MTGQELVWLEGISRLRGTMDKIFLDLPSDLTEGSLRSLAQQLDGCTRELARLGPATERLQPVYELAKRGCAEYDKSAKCFDTAPNIVIPIAGTDAEREFTQAINCGLAAPRHGGVLFIGAEVKGFEIKDANR